MRRRVAALGAAAASTVLLLAACSDPPTHGYVYSIDYEAPSSVWWGTSYSHSACYSLGYSWSWDGCTEYVAADWRLELCKQAAPPSGANSCGWLDVDSETYHSVRLGQYYTTTAQFPPPASSA